jgi:hypothetical protein
MDKTQLVTIIVTAIITAFAKVIVEGLSALTRKLFANKLKTKLSKIVNKSSLYVLIDLIFIIFAIWQLGRLINDPNPLTRGAVFAISFWTLFVAYWGDNLVAHLFFYNYYLDEPNRRAKQTEINKKLDELLLQTSETEQQRTRSP